MLKVVLAKVSYSTRTQNTLAGHAARALLTRCRYDDHVAAGDHARFAHKSPCRARGDRSYVFSLVLMKTVVGHCLVLGGLLLEKRALGPQDPRGRLVLLPGLRAVRRARQFLPSEFSSRLPTSVGT